MLCEWRVVLPQSFQCQGIIACKSPDNGKLKRCFEFSLFFLKKILGYTLRKFSTPSEVMYNSTVRLFPGTSVN